MNKVKVIVYGTLKQGFGRGLETWSGENVKLGDVVLKGYQMWDCGCFPAVMEGPGIIEAEVWEIPKKYLPDLDTYEGHPRLFIRTEIDIPEYGSVYIYLGNNCLAKRMIYDGYWRG